MIIQVQLVYIFPHYSLEKCKTFLETFRSSDSKTGEYKYRKILQDVANRECLTVLIELDDVESFGEEDFLLQIEKNTRRYINLFADAVHLALPMPSKAVIDLDVRDVLIVKNLL